MIRYPCKRVPMSLASTRQRTALLRRRYCKEKIDYIDGGECRCVAAIANYLAGFLRAPRPLHAQTHTAARSRINARCGTSCRHRIHYCHSSVLHSYLSLDLLITTRHYLMSCTRLLLKNANNLCPRDHEGGAATCVCITNKKIKPNTALSCARLIHLFLAVNALRLTKRCG